MFEMPNFYYQVEGLCICKHKRIVVWDFVWREAKVGLMWFFHVLCTLRIYYFLILQLTMRSTD